MIAKALTLPADGLILDLEDAVPPDRKAATRPIVREWLQKLDFGGRERWVRMNPIFTDLAVARTWRRRSRVGPTATSCRSRATRATCARSRSSSTPRASRTACRSARTQARRPSPPRRRKGCSTSREIAAASPRIVALSLGHRGSVGGDGAAPRAGRRRPVPRHPALRARDVRGRGLRGGRRGIDTVYTDIADLDGLRRECEEGVAMGFTGKISIHPEPDRRHQRGVHAVAGGPGGGARAGGAVRRARRARASSRSASRARWWTRPHLTRARKVIARAGGASGPR